MIPNGRFCDMISFVSGSPSPLTAPHPIPPVMKFFLGYLTIVCMYLAIANSVKAQSTITYLDLVDPSIAQVTLGAGEFSAEVRPGTAGTGNFDTFLKINAKGVEEGYNTSAPGVLDNTNAPWTHDLQVGDLRIIQDLSGNYLVALGMDLNEPNSVGAQYQSLDAFQVYVSPFGSQSVTDPTMLGTLVYSMDAISDSAILLDVTRNASGGSGRSDLNIYLDLSLFNGVQQTDYVYFYMKMGGVGLGEAPQYPTLDFRNDGGFDELRREYSLQSIPEPSTVGLAAIGLLALTTRRKRGRTYSSTLISPPTGPARSPILGSSAKSKFLAATRDRVMAAVGSTGMIVGLSSSLLPCLAKAGSFRPIQNRKNLSA